jgi:hypothetical protein
MMYSIHIDESATRVDCCTAVTSFIYLFSKKLNSLLDHLDNQHMMHGSQNDVLEWVHLNQNDIHYCSGATLHCL